MAKLLKPCRLDTDPSSPTAAKEWKHWHRTFQNFMEESGETAPNKLKALVNCVSPSVYELIEDCATYEGAVAKLESVYVKLPNEIFARHVLATRRQQSGESLDEFLRELHKLSKGCNFKAVTAEQYREEMVRDAFINGIASAFIRQRLLENKSLDLEAGYSQARTLDLAQRNADSYTSSLPVPHAAALVPGRQGQPCDGQQPQSTKEEAERRSPVDSTVAAAHSSKKKCYFCGNALHITGRSSCPARAVTCNNCGKTGHFAKVCRSKGKTSDSTTATLYNPTLLTLAATFPKNLSHAATDITVNGHSLKALIDSCSSDSFISEKVAQKLKLTVVLASKEISMASASLNTSSPGYVMVDLGHVNQNYPCVQLGVLKDLCCDVILGHDFQKQHESVTFQYGGNKPSLRVTSNCALATADIEEPSLFPNLPQQCKPIAVKSRRYSEDDQLFISDQLSRLLSESIIEPSISPWRAQVVVVKDPLDRHKKRLCIDYSQTINQYTELDAYPLPRIEDMVHSLAKYKVFSTFDLKSAYHQISIKESERKYTAFEGAGKLYQFCRVPFGVTNGVAVFQRAMDKLVGDEGLKDTFPYLDNITVAGSTQDEHDSNVKKFLEVIQKRKLTHHESKSVKSVPTINVLGHCVGNNVIRPDPDRLRPLQELPPPTNIGSLRRVQGLFAYYAKWIPGFSDKIQPLINTKTFPLSESALAAFNTLKRQLTDASLRVAGQ
ncbi:uncharacterized protein LOC143032026 [Oratosquilla oratoria]|uniref:uncharacterized protein LOC143032026 n=1 Tax=Oratosquilla oratoria TaxID=337810 RepID=UPI003F776E99